MAAAGGGAAVGAAAAAVVAAEAGAGDGVDSLLGSSGLISLLKAGAGSTSFCGSGSAGDL